MSRSNLCPKCGAQTTFARVWDGRYRMACERGVPLDHRTSPPEPEPEPTLEERVARLERIVEVLREIFNV